MKYARILMKNWLDQNPHLQIIVTRMVNMINDYQIIKIAMM